MYANGSLDRYIRRYDVTPDGALRTALCLSILQGKRREALPMA